MHSNNNNSKYNSDPKQQHNILVFENSILSLENNIIKIQSEFSNVLKELNKLKEFNQLLKCAVDQPPPQSSRLSRTNRHGLRSQPYPYPPANSLQARRLAQGTDQFDLTGQNSLHYTRTLHSSQQLRSKPYGTQSTDKFDLVTEHNLCSPPLQIQDLITERKSSHRDSRSLQSPLLSQSLQPAPSAAQGTGQFGPYHTLRSPLPKSFIMQAIDKYGLMTEQDPSQYNTHTLQSSLPQQHLLNSSAVQVTDVLDESPPQPNQFGLMAGQNSPYHDTHTLRSPLPKQQHVPPIEATDQFGHLMSEQISTSQQLTSHMIRGETYPSPSDFQSPEFDDSGGTQKGK